VTHLFLASVTNRLVYLGCPVGRPSTHCSPVRCPSVH